MDLNTALFAVALLITAWLVIRAWQRKPKKRCAECGAPLFPDSFKTTCIDCRRLAAMNNIVTKFIELRKWEATQMRRKM